MLLQLLEINPYQKSVIGPLKGVVSEFASGKNDQVCIIFYRSFLASEDMAAVERLSDAFVLLDYQVVGIFHQL